MKAFLNYVLNTFYALMVFVWAFAGLMFAMRTVGDADLKTNSEVVRYYCYSVGSSMIIGWLVCEVCFYFGLPVGLCGAVSSAAGLVGANTVASIFLKIIHKKLDLGELKEDSKDASE